MKKVLTIIVAVGFISSMLVNTASAGGRHGGGISPLWIPVAILSTLAAVTIAQPQQVVYERRAEYEPRQTVVYEEPRPIVVYQEPRHYRYARYYERDRDCESPRYRDYR
jgi:hypothetical protein